MEPAARKILEAGAMYIRRTSKPYARCAVGLNLEQTVNRDAASPMKDITVFRNSESSFRRWSVTLSQRGMSLSEVCELAGVESAEQPANQLNKWRILSDNADMDALTHSLESLCNPFSTDHQNSELFNLSSGKAANEETKNIFFQC